MSDYLAFHGLLSFAGEAILVLMSPALGIFAMILCYTMVDQKNFGSILIYSLFSTFINAFLKDIWRVPLKPGVGNQYWYSYPSGHTQFAIVLCCCLAIATRSWKLLVILLLLIIAFCVSIVDHGFHDWDDVLGAIVPGLAMSVVFLALSYSSWYQSGKFYYFGAIMMAIEFVILCNLQQLSCNSAYCKFVWLWISWGFSLGLLVSWMIAINMQADHNVLRHPKSNHAMDLNEEVMYKHLSKNTIVDKGTSADRRLSRGLVRGLNSANATYQAIFSKDFWYTTSLHSIFQNNSTIAAITKTSVIIALVTCLNLGAKGLRSYFLIFTHIETVIAFAIGMAATGVAILARRFGDINTKSLF